MLSPSGTPLWAYIMTEPASTSTAWNTIVPTALGGALLGGDINHVGSTNGGRPIFVEIDEEGAIRWMTEVDLGADVSGEILAVGTADYQDTSDNPTLRYANGLVLRLSANDGMVLSAFAAGGDLADEATSVVMFADGSYAIGGQTLLSSRERTKAWIASFGADDTLRWSAT